MFVDADNRVHVCPWDEGNNRIARDHVVGECWCKPDVDFVTDWGSILLHHEATWPNSSESVN